MSATTFEMRDAIKPVFLAALADQSKRPLIVLASDEARAREYARDIESWIPGRTVRVFSDPDQPAYSPMSISQGILSERAAVFTDGRYTLQIEDQVNHALYERRHVTEDPPHDWVAANLGRGAKLCYDPWLHTPRGLERYHAACAKAGGELVLPRDRQPRSASSLKPHP